jgi:hypothetical protein
MQGKTLSLLSFEEEIAGEEWMCSLVSETE